MVVHATWWTLLRTTASTPPIARCAARRMASGPCLLPYALTSPFLHSQVLAAPSHRNEYIRLRYIGFEERDSGEGGSGNRTPSAESSTYGGLQTQGGLQTKEDAPRWRPGPSPPRDASRCSAMDPPLRWRVNRASPLTTGASRLISRLGDCAICLQAHSNGAIADIVQVGTLP
jgi:hypothetical protein